MGHRTKTYDNKTTKCFGYQHIAYTRIQPVGWPMAEPLVTERIAVVPANADQIAPAWRSSTASPPKIARWSRS